ncbi:MAG: hypothetical protein LBD68_05250 [Zoogloeaceae bacterium]|nr:hypothetical protein [Zoogloeaceae bacterium]
MSMFLFNALFASALFAKDLEFEFEALDFYDPLTPNLEKREWLDNLSIEGVYEKKAERLKWRAPDRRGAAGFHRRNES